MTPITRARQRTERTVIQKYHDGHREKAVAAAKKALAALTPGDAAAVAMPFTLTDGAAVAHDLQFREVLEHVNGLAEGEGDYYMPRKDRRALAQEITAEGVRAATGWEINETVVQDAFSYCMYQIEQEERNAA